jgi:hypothetical protein
MLARSPAKKESVELRGSRMGTKKKTRLQKREDRVHWSAMKRIETYCYSAIYFFNSD